MSLQTQVAAALAGLTESITLSHVSTPYTVAALLIPANSAQVTEFLSSHVGATALHPCWLLILDGTQTLVQRGDTFTRDHYPLIVEGVDVQRIGGTIVSVTALAVPSSLP